MICSAEGLGAMTENGKEVFKPIDIGNRKPFAMGGTGECYRIDEDTILKLYYEGFPEERILSEKEGARAALVAGVPTAISYWLVRVGQRQGILYEMVQGKTIAEEICEEGIGRAKALGRTFAGIAKTLHQAEMRLTNLPPATLRIRNAIQGAGYMPERTRKRLNAFLDELDGYHQYVHGDFHPNNVIMTKEGPVLIDMGGFSSGCSLFDLASCFFNLFESPEARAGGRSPINKLTQREAHAFWQGMEEEYFSGRMSPSAAMLLKKIVLLKKIRFEILYGKRYSESYCQEIRQEALDTF